MPPRSPAGGARRRSGESAAGPLEQWRKNVYILAAADFLTMVSFSMVLPFLPLYLKEMGGVRQVEVWAGLIYGASFLTGSLMAPVWGALGDRFGQKAMVLRSGVSITGVTALMALVGSPFQLLVLRLLSGSLGGFLPASNTLAATAAPLSEVGYSLSLLQAGAAAGNIAGPILGGLLADSVGMRPTFLAASGVMAAATALVAAFIRADPRPAAPAPHGDGFSARLRSLWSSGPVRAILILIFLVQVGSAAVQPVIALLIEQMSGAGGGAVSVKAGLVFSAAGFATVLGTPAFAALGRRRRLAPLLAGAVGGAGLASALQGLAGSTAHLAAARFGFGLFQGGASTLTNALVARFVDPALHGGAYGLASSAWMLGTVIGSVAGGAAGSALGLRAPFWAAGLLLLVLAAWAGMGGLPAAAPGKDKEVKGRVK